MSHPDIYLTPTGARSGQLRKSDDLVKSLMDGQESGISAKSIQIMDRFYTTGETEFFAFDVSIEDDIDAVKFCLYPRMDAPEFVYSDGQPIKDGAPAITAVARMSDRVAGPIVTSAVGSRARAVGGYYSFAAGSRRQPPTKSHSEGRRDLLDVTFAGLTRYADWSGVIRALIQKHMSEWPNLDLYARPRS